jgi:arylsulfatase A-like enzyme
MDSWGFTHGLDSEGKLDAVRSYLENNREPTGPYMAFLARRGLADRHAADFSSRDPWLDTHPTPLPSDAYCDNWIGRCGLETIQAFDRERPWFLAVNFTGPHNPQDVTTEMAGWYADARFPPASGNDDVDPTHLNRIRQNYAAMCENVDRWIGHYLDLLTERGERDETLVVFSSDHGEMLGDRNRWGKSLWYQHSIGIPLVVAGPSIACRRRGELVQLQDLAPTFLSVANAESLPGSDAASLLPLLTAAAGNPKWHRAVARSGLNEWEARWDGRWKLVVERDLPVRLYDHASDPEESTDLLAGDSLSTAAAAARDRLHRCDDKQDGQGEKR